MSWLHATTTMPHWALACLVAAAAIGTASTGYQTRRCRRWHVDIGEEGYEDDNYAEWDGSEPESVPATVAKPGRGTGKAAS